MAETKTITMCFAVAAVFTLGADLLRASVIVEASQDTYIREGNGGTPADSTDTSLLMATDNAGNNDNVKKAYFKFDLSSLNPDPNAAATLVLTLGYDVVNTGNSGRTMYVYGLNAGFTPGTGIKGTDWLASELSWANAPANDTVTDIDAGFTSDATLVQVFGGLAKDMALGITFTANIANLGDFLQADKTVTFMASFTDTQSKGLASSENTEYDGPMLTFEQVPEPASMALLGLGGLLIARRRRA